jgi:hypothetical protein
MESRQSCRKRDERFTRVIEPASTTPNHVDEGHRRSQARLQPDSFAEHGQSAPRQSECVRF